MPNDISRWIVAWLQNRNPGVGIDVAQNFYDAGYLDSFGVIELIDDTEAHFGIRLAQADFSSRTFATVDGLASIIARKLA
jgi:acyl carrier protein